jgi:hypothetical protein
MVKCYKCVICGGLFEGYGNNPWPIADENDGRCCDKCNETKVIPERINLMMGYNYDKEQSK